MASSIFKPATKEDSLARIKELDDKDKKDFESQFGPLEVGDILCYIISDYKSYEKYYIVKDIDISGVPEIETDHLKTGMDMIVLKPVSKVDPDSDDNIFYIPKENNPAKYGYNFQLYKSWGDLAINNRVWGPEKIKTIIKGEDYVIEDAPIEESVKDADYLLSKKIVEDESIFKVPTAQDKIDRKKQYEELQKKNMVDAIGFLPEVGDYMTSKIVYNKPKRLYVVSDVNYSFDEMYNIYCYPIGYAHDDNKTAYIDYSVMPELPVSHANRYRDYSSSVVNQYGYEIHWSIKEVNKRMRGPGGFQPEFIKKDDLEKRFKRIMVQEGKQPDLFVAISKEEKAARTVEWYAHMEEKNVRDRQEFREKFGTDLEVGDILESGPGTVYSTDPFYYLVIKKIIPPKDLITGNEVHDKGMEAIKCMVIYRNADGTFNDPRKPRKGMNKKSFMMPDVYVFSWQQLLHFNEAYMLPGFVKVIKKKDRIVESEEDIFKAASPDESVARKAEVGQRELKKISDKYADGREIKVGDYYRFKHVSTGLWDGVYEVYYHKITEINMDREYMLAPLVDSFYEIRKDGKGIGMMHYPGMNPFTKFDMASKIDFDSVLLFDPTTHEFISKDQGDKEIAELMKLVQDDIDRRAKKNMSESTEIISDLFKPITTDEEEARKKEYRERLIRENNIEKKLFEDKWGPLHVGDIIHTYMKNRQDENNPHLYYFFVKEITVATKKDERELQEIVDGMELVKLINIKKVDNEYEIDPLQPLGYQMVTIYKDLNSSPDDEQHTGLIIGNIIKIIRGETVTESENIFKPVNDVEKKERKDEYVFRRLKANEDAKKVFDEKYGPLKIDDMLSRVIGIETNRLRYYKVMQSGHIGADSYDTHLGFVADEYTGQNIIGPYVSIQRQIDIKPISYANDPYIILAYTTLISHDLWQHIKVYHQGTEEWNEAMKAPKSY